MASQKTSRKRGGFSLGKPLELKPGANVERYEPAESLRDPESVSRAIYEALREGDYEAVVTIYRAHLRVLNRTHAAEALKVSRQSVHKMLRAATAPSLETFTAFMHLLQEERRHPEIATAGAR